MVRAVFEKVEEELNDATAEVIVIWPDGGEFDISPSPLSMEIQDFPDGNARFGQPFRIYYLHHKASYDNYGRSERIPYRVQYKGSPTASAYHRWEMSLQNFSESAGAYETDCTVADVAHKLYLFPRSDKYSAYWSNANHSLRITKQGEGHVQYGLSTSYSPKSAAFIAPEGTSISMAKYDDAKLAAYPSEGWGFSHWEGSDGGVPIDEQSSRRAWLMVGHGDIDVRAFFEPLPDCVWNLSVAVQGGGTVATSPDSTLFGWNQEVTVTATAEPGWAFSHWADGSSGEIAAFSPNYTFDINRNTSLEAVFVPAQQVLRVEIEGQGIVQRTLNAVTYPNGTEVNLTAQPAPGWEFQGWREETSAKSKARSAPTEDTSPNKTVTMDGPKTVAPIFVPKFIVRTDTNDDRNYDENDDTGIPELMRVNDDQDNGAGFSESLHNMVTAPMYTLTSSTKEYVTHSDDAQPIRIGLGDPEIHRITEGEVRVSPDFGEHLIFSRSPAIRMIWTSWGSHYSSLLAFPFHPSKEVSLPTEIYAFADSELLGSDVDKEITLRFDYVPVGTNAETQSREIKLKIVGRIGSTSYFDAALDYLTEHKSRGAKLFTEIQTVRGPREAGIGFGTINEYYRTVVMPKKDTSIGVTGDLFPNIYSVSQANSGYDVIINGGWFSGGSGRLHGYLVTNGQLDSHFPYRTRWFEDGRAHDYNNFIASRTGDKGDIYFGTIPFNTTAYVYDTRNNYSMGLYRQRSDQPREQFRLDANTETPENPNARGCAFGDHVGDAVDIHAEGWTNGLVGLSTEYEDKPPANLIGEAETSKPLPGQEHGESVIFLAMTSNAGGNYHIPLMSAWQGSLIELMRDKLIQSGGLGTKVYRLDGGASCGMFIRPLAYQGGPQPGVVVRNNRHTKDTWKQGERVNSYLMFKVGN
jgi:hypothetical protein